MRGYFPKNVSEYTKEQCQEYLEKYPNSLNSESVKKRLELLKNPSNENFQKCEVIDNPSYILSANKDTEDNKNATNTNSAEGTKIWVVIGAIIVIIAFVILSMLMWDWIKETFPVLAGIMCIVFVIKNIFFKD